MLSDTDALLAMYSVVMYSVVLYSVVLCSEVLCCVLCCLLSLNHLDLGPCVRTMHATERAMAGCASDACCIRQE